MKIWKTPVSALATLFDSFVMGSYTSDAGSDGDFDGVPKIPAKGDPTSEGIAVKNRKLYNELHNLERETWDLVARYHKKLRRYS